MIKKKASMRQGMCDSFADQKRIETLRSYQILNSTPENDFDEITNLAVKVFKCPVAYISFVDKNRSWFKSIKCFDNFGSGKGLGFLKIPVEFFETSYDNEDIIIVQDTLLDNRFSNLPCVIQHPYIRFYAATPIYSSIGHKLGYLCIMDNNVNDLSDSEKMYLKFLANRVVRLLELRRNRFLLSNINSNSLLENTVDIFDKNEMEICNSNVRFLHNQKSNSSNSECTYFQSEDNNIIVYDKYKFVSIQQIIENAISACHDEIKFFQIKLSLTWDLNPNLIIECKPFLISHVFSSILQNAIQFIKDKKYKWIDIALKEFVHDIEIVVSDSRSIVEDSIQRSANNDKQGIPNLLNYLNQYIGMQGGQVLMQKNCEQMTFKFILPKKILEYIN